MKKMKSNINIFQPHQTVKTQLRLLQMAQTPHQILHKYVFDNPATIIILFN